MGVWPGDLRRSCVSMMEPADLRDRNDVASFSLLNLARCRRIAVKAKSWPGFVKTGEVVLQDAHQIDFIEHDHVIHAFSSDRADHPFHKRQTKTQK